LPFVSYPYEWPFEMLRDAALLQLGLIEEALAEDVVLKDGTPYNVQWRGAEPVFVDVGSFERLPPGEPWAGYRQFCMLFLYPLMLQAYRGIAPQPWPRGSLEGIEPRGAGAGRLGARRQRRARLGGGRRGARCRGRRRRARRRRARQRAAAGGVADDPAAGGRSRGRLARPRLARGRAPAARGAWAPRPP